MNARCSLPRLDDFSRAICFPRLRSSTWERGGKKSVRLPTQLHPSDSTFFETVLLHFLRHRREETAATATASALPHAHICLILRGSIIIRRS